MALSNAERQRRWRDNRKVTPKPGPVAPDLAERVSALEELVSRLSLCVESLEFELSLLAEPVVLVEPVVVVEPEPVESVEPVEAVTVTVTEAEPVVEPGSGVTHRVTLYSDAKAKKDRFGITASDGSPVWYGRFFDSDKGYNGEQSSGEMEAAKKAVWLASKVRDAVGGVVELELFVDADWLTYANESYGKQGGKAKVLRNYAKKLGIPLNVQWVSGLKNPADAYTICDGFMKYTETDLSLLAVPVV